MTEHLRLASTSTWSVLRLAPCWSAQVQRCAVGHGRLLPWWLVPLALVAGVPLALAEVAGVPLAPWLRVHRLLAACAVFSHVDWRAAAANGPSTEVNWRRWHLASSCLLLLLRSWLLRCLCLLRNKCGWRWRSWPLR